MKHHMHRIATLIMAGCLTLTLSGCGGKRGENQPPPDLTGDWIQIGGVEYYHTATITEDEIEIYWYLVEEDEAYLYWKGTFTPPENAVEPYVWESENQMSNHYPKVRRYADPSETKEFSYQDGKITYTTYYGRLKFITQLQRPSE